VTARAGALGLALLALTAGGADRDRAGSGEGWTLAVLGIAQDGGMPHLGCTSPPCSDARAGRRRPEKVACLGLRHQPSGESYVFDATPDFPAQLHALTGGRLPDGIFLTHAHIGHYTGLMYLGREVAGAHGVPVHATARMADYLARNGPWSALVTDGRVVLRVLDPDRPVELPHGLRVTAFKVPHRDEYSDTVGYRIEGPRRKAAFIPDIDRWDKWDRSVHDLADGVDLLFVDGTFSSPNELPGRDVSEIPHPLMRETRALVRGTRARLLFIHLNHTNRALVDGEDVAREGMRFPL
jgi:pyrroloquinoline quinone biosynthesis protein B